MVYGHDEYIKSETVRKAVGAHVPKEEKAFSVSHLIAGQTDASEILAAAQAVPLLGTRTAVIVHDAHRLAAVHKSRLTDAMDRIGHPSLLVFVGPEELDKRTKFYKWFADAGHHVLCEPLTEAQAEQFAAKQLADSGKKAGPGTLARLLSHTGPDAGILAQEAEKLALFVGDREEIQIADVDTVAGHARGYDVEAWIGAQLEGNSRRALMIGRGLIAAGEDATVLVGRLATHYFDLYRATLSSERNPWKLAGALRVPAARAEQLSEWRKIVNQQRLGAALEYVADADALAKSGRADPVAVVDSLSLALADGNILRSLGF